MHVRFFLFFILTVCVVNNTQGAAEPPEVTVSVTPIDKDNWTVKITTSSPVQTLAFAEDVGDFRKETWFFDTPLAEIIQNDKTEYIQLSNGEPFTEIQAKVKAFKAKIVKGYVAFAEFTNGAIRVYSAQFRLVPGNGNGVSENDAIQSDVYFYPGAFGEIFADNRWSKQKVKYDHNRAENDLDGYVVFGRVAQTEFSGGNLLLDGGLPSWVREGIVDMLPIAANYFTERMGSHAGNETTTIISFSPDESAGSSSLEGGVLADQVHFHISGSGWREPDEELAYRLGWVAAHEVAHVWNAFGKFKPAYFEAEFQDSWEGEAHWLHEGGAEMLTYKALKETDTLPTVFLSQFVEENYRQCLASLSSGPLNKAAEQQRFPDYYKCGFIFGVLTEAACEQSDKDYIDIWQLMTHQASKGRYSQKDYLQALSTCEGSQDAIRLIEKATREQLDEPGRLFEETFKKYNIAIVNGYPRLH